MPRGSLEVIEFAPRQAGSPAVPEDRGPASEDFWSRIRQDHRTLTSCAAALAAITLHLLLAAPAIWGSRLARAHPPERPGGPDIALQWVTLHASSDAGGGMPPSLSFPSLATLSVANALPRLPYNPVGTSSDEEDGDDLIPAGLEALYGRYVGQIQARIDRAWQRPRTAIGAPIFQCSTQIDQDRRGTVVEVTLLSCNGDTRWKLSLVQAIEAASPLPAPPDQAVFARHVLLEFRAMAYSKGAPAELYEPPATAAGESTPSRPATLPQDVFHALRDVSRAPRSHQIITLRIEGSSAEVESENK